MEAKTVFVDTYGKN